MRLIVRHALERKLLEREKARLEALTQRQNEELKALNASLEAKVQARTAELHRAHDALAAANEKLKTSFLTSIKVFSNLIELRGGAMAGHSRRVADLARRIAPNAGAASAARRRTCSSPPCCTTSARSACPTPCWPSRSTAPRTSADELGLFKKHPAQGRGGADGAGAAARRRPPDALATTNATTAWAIRTGSPDSPSRSARASSRWPTTTTRCSRAPSRPSAPSAEEALQYLRAGRGHRYDPAVLDALDKLLGGPAKAEAGPLPIQSDKLKPGMVLARDLVTRDGVLLLAHDFSLTTT